jgi:imidazoleglycerol phosphate synthase glutamine amidotransferase subunit HisH
MAVNQSDANLIYLQPKEVYNMIAIIKYNGGNVSSVQNALNRLNISSVITDDPELILKADKVIFPV